MKGIDDRMDGAHTREMNTTQQVSEWDVRDGMVYRDGRGVVSFSEYHQAHPNGMTVEEWEASKRTQVQILAYGRKAPR